MRSFELTTAWGALGLLLMACSTADGPSPDVSGSISTSSVAGTNGFSSAASSTGAGGDVFCRNHGLERCAVGPVRRQFIVDRIQCQLERQEWCELG